MTITWNPSYPDDFKPNLMNTVKKGHARTFSSELFHTLLLKIPKVSNILGNNISFCT
jgi:hypothetical protein